MGFSMRGAETQRRESLSGCHVCLMQELQLGLRRASIGWLAAKRCRRSRYSVGSAQRPGGLWPPAPAPPLGESLLVSVWRWCLPGSHSHDRCRCQCPSGAGTGTRSLVVRDTANGYELRSITSWVCLVTESGRQYAAYPGPCLFAGTLSLRVLRRRAKLPSWLSFCSSAGWIGLGL